MTSWAGIEKTVEGRANNRCEYCRMHQSLQGATFHVEHIQPRSLGGESQLNNLAWACPSCNLHKSNRVAYEFGVSRERVPLFNPRTDVWSKHFRWQGHQLIGLTTIGGATIEALCLNHERRVRIRKAEELFDLFPPPE